MFGMFGIEKDFRQLMEQAYGPLGEKQQMTEIEKTNEPSGWNPVFEFPLDERDTIIIDWVKYKRVEEPPTLYDKLETWIEYGNFAQSKDVLVNEILNIVKEFIPEPYEGFGLSEYFLGYNDAIRKMEEKLN